ncbi:Wadjet anti-phage system protein JetD domain-containing protein [Caenispirillum salinarum]|uniref:Wadjet anti-phage system protein JetD domain-containing protein n=1 Tax=Caenispirillum salinarum TaxID=859058 RepID=UPI00384F1F3C
MIDDDAELPDSLVDMFWSEVRAAFPERRRIPSTDAVPVAARVIRETGRNDWTPRRFLACAAESLSRRGLTELPASRNLWDPSVHPPLPAFFRNTAAGPRLDRPAHRVEHPWHEALEFLAGEKALRNADDWLAIDRWLKRHGRGADMASMRERSYQIFGDDKRLEKVIARKAFTDGRFPIGLLRIEIVPEPLVARFRPDAPGRRALLVENKDTFRSACVVNADTRTFSCVIFGGGGAASARMRGVRDLLEQAPFDILFYFGDVDAEGLRIAARTEAALADAAPEVAFMLADPLYEALSGRRGIGSFGRTGGTVMEFLERHGMARLVDPERGRIPQEALTRADLERLFLQICERECPDGTCRSLARHD